MHKFSLAGEIKCLKNCRIEGDCRRNNFPFFIKREAGDMNVSFITGLFIKNDLKWIRVINTEKLRRNKNINTGAAK